MEALKSFENLSDTDKIKFFELLGSLSESKATASVSNEDSEKPTSVSPKANFNEFVEKFKSGVKENVKITSPTVESKAKQKTLDSWLIRRGGSKNKVSTSTTAQDTNADVNEVEISLPSTSSASNYLQHLVACSPKNSVSIKEANCTVEISKDVSTRYNQSTISPNEGESSCNLRRSKRKCSKWSSYATLDNSNIKSSKNLPDLNSKNIKLDENVRTNKANVKSLLTADSALGLSSENVSDSYPTRLNVDSNTIQSGEKNMNSVSNSNSPNKSQASYNLRAKRKITKKLQDALELENCSLRSISNHRTERSETEHTTGEDSASPVSESDYEAFCKMSADCKHFGIDIQDILLHESMQKLLADYKDSAFNDAVILVGNHKCSSGKIVPVVHTHSSKSKLLDLLQEAQLLQKKK